MMPRTSLFILSLAFAVQAHAASATWQLNPGSGAWTMAANWSPNVVPNGPSDAATFGISNTTASIEVAEIDFSPGASF